MSLLKFLSLYILSSDAKHGKISIVSSLKLLCPFTLYSDAKTYKNIFTEITQCFLSLCYLQMHNLIEFA